MCDGTRKELALDSAHASVRLRGKLPYRDAEGVILYSIYARLNVDGYPVHMTRNIPKQENFTDPPCFMGLRAWLDATRDISDFLGQHGPSAKCFPKNSVVW